MILRQLGMNAQELEAGPYTFLLSHSIPVAYKDARQAPGAFRTDAWFSKATTAHLNKWLKDTRHAVIPHDMIIAAFQSISKWSDQPRTEAEARGQLDRLVR